MLTLLKLSRILFPFRLININDFFFSIISLIVLFTFVFLYIKTSNYRHSFASDDYYLYNKKLGKTLLTLTIIATQIGGGTIVGVADASYKMGFAGLLYPIGLIVGLLIIAFWLGSPMKSANIPTISAIFEKKYNSPTIRKFSSIISSISLISIMVAQGIAIKHLLTALGLPEFWLLTLIWFVVVLYTSFGGIKTVVKTNVIQILLISGSLSVLLIYTLTKIDLSSITIINNNSFDFHLTIDWFIWPCCYMLIEQDMAQLFFSARSKKIIKKSAILAAIGIMLLATIPTIIGMIVKNQPITPISDNGILLFFAKNYLSTPIYIITSIAIILAITSTIDSLLCAVSSNISYDFPTSLYKKKFPTNIIITLLSGIISFIMIFFCENIINTLMFSYGIYVSAFLVPALCGFLLPKIKLQKSSLIFSIFFGLISFIILSAVSSEFSYISILFSIVGYTIPIIINHIRKFIIYS